MLYYYSRWKEGKGNIKEISLESFQFEFYHQLIRWGTRIFLSEEDAELGEVFMSLNRISSLTEFKQYLLKF